MAQESRPPKEFAPVAQYHSAAQTMLDDTAVPIEVDVAGRMHLADANSEITIFASAARTASANSSDLTNLYARGVIIYLDITSRTGTNPTLDVKVAGKDSVAAKYFDLTGASYVQQTAAGQTDLVIYPGIGETANRAVSDVLPLTWRIVTTIGGTDTPTFTYSIAASYIR